MALPRFGSVAPPRVAAPVRFAPAPRLQAMPRADPYVPPPGVQGGAAPGASKKSTGYKAPPAPEKKKRDDPIKRVQTNVAKLLAARGGFEPENQARLDRILKDVGQGVPSYEQQQYARRRTQSLSHLPGSVRADAERILQSIPTGSGLQQPSRGAMRERGAEALEAAGFAPGMARRAADLYFPDRASGDFISTPVGAAVRFLGKGQQAVASGIGEASRQWESEDLPFSPGEIGRGIREGWNLQRHDTASSILAEAEKIREEQGESTGPILGATNAAIRTVPGTGLVADMAFGAATDPLTYMTFGMSALAKGGIRTIARVIDADTAANVARNGLRVLTPAERATVEANVGARGMQALERGAQGGFGVRRFMGPATGKTLIPGFIPKAGTEAVGTAVRSIPGIGDPLARAGRFAQNVFVPRAKLARNAAIGGKDTASDIYALTARAKGFQHAGTDRAVTRLTNAMARARVTPQEMAEVIGPQLDIGASGIVNTGDAARDAVLQPIVDRFSAVRRDITELRQSRPQGALLRETDPRFEPWMVHEAEHMPHVRTPEGDKLWNSGKLEGSSFGKMLHSDPYMQGRQIRDMSARQINETLSAELGYPIKYFHEDPLVAFAASARAAYGTTASDELVRGLLALETPQGGALIDQWDSLDDVMGNPANMSQAQIQQFVGPAPMYRGGTFGGPVSGVLAPGQKLQRPGYVELKLLDPATGGAHHLSVPGEVKELVENTWRTIHDPSEIEEAWDKMMTWWKTMATVPLPFGLGFHLRNAESNVLLNWMSAVGVEASDYVRARSIQRQMRKGVKESGDWQQYLSAADQSLIQDALEREVLSTGVLGALEDLPVDAKLGAGYTLRSKGWGARAGHVLQRANIFSTKGLPATSGRRLARGVEENARLAHFIAATRNMGNVDEAAMSVRRWLFDYSDLTRSEQRIKRVLPFYTWSRKAMSAVLETALRDPRKLAQFERLRQQLTEAGGADLSETMVPDYLRESPTGVPFRAPVLGPLTGAAEFLGYPEAGTLMYADPDTPFNSPFEQLNAAYGLAAGAPVLNRILPQYGSKSVVENVRPFVSMLGGPSGVGRAAFEALVGEKAYSGAPLRDEWGPVPSPLNLPILKQLFAPSGQMTPAGRNLAESIWPAIPKIEGVVGNDPRNEDKRWRRFVSILTGIPIAPVDVATQEAEGYRRNEILNQFARNMQAQGEIPVG
jgi:hypothetical protein